MNTSPTESRRTVMLDIQTSNTDQPQPDRTRPTGTEAITCISIVIDDGTWVNEATLQNAAEKDLLRQFWQLVQPHDVFFGRNIASRLALLRRASWRLDLIPSSGVDLRAVYQYSTVETGGQQSSSGNARYRSAGALAYLLGLPGNRPRGQEVSCCLSPYPHHADAETDKETMLLLASQTGTAPE